MILNIVMYLRYCDCYTIVLFINTALIFINDAVISPIPFVWNCQHSL